ncbi:MAG: hypothetical protein GY866_15730 [Proteobacteria bacterium]|nr:hypothetical protein [Pseudomonadota bacterium]
MEEYFRYLRLLKFLDEKIDPKIEKEIFKIMYKVGEWYSSLYREETFDFGANPDFFTKGKDTMHEFFKYRKYFHANKEFIFLDRTRYGLFRIFERLKAKVKIRNPYES